MEKIKGRNGNSIIVKQYDLAGNFIAEHKSMAEAYRSVFAANGSNISNVLDTSDSAYGFKWKRA